MIRHGQNGLYALLFLFAAALSACNTGGKQDIDAPAEGAPDPAAENDQPSTNSSSARIETGVPAAPLVFNPLTGLSADDPVLLDRRPVMVKVSNFPREGRPHAGLSYADIVFDYFIGYGQNRFLALFYGADAYKIGPLRSGRRVDAQLVTMYNGVLAYGSADADTDAVLVNALGDYALSHLEVDCPAFCGIDTHSASGVFANSRAISAHVSASGWENSQPDLPGMVFDAQPPASTSTGEKLTIFYNYYNRGEWRYDLESGRYLRWIEDVKNEGKEDEVIQMIPLMDRLTNEQLAFANVIVIFAEYTELAPSAHEIDIWGNKTGYPLYLFRDGVLVRGLWKTTNTSDPMQFFDLDGEMLALKPGNTWISIMGLSSSFNEVSQGEWESFFFLP